MFVWFLQWRSMWFPCVSTQLSALRRIDVFILSKIFGFTQFSWQAFSTRCCNTANSLIASEFTKDFRCSNSQKSIGLRPGDRAGQVTGPLCPIHCSLKVWFRCCRKMHRKWGDAPSCMNKSGSGAASQRGEHEVVPHHAWPTHVLSMKGRVLKEYW
jgi:hypothetical protein